MLSIPQTACVALLLLSLFSYHADSATTIGDLDLQPDAHYIASSLGKTTADVWDDISGNGHDATGIVNVDLITTGQFSNGRPFFSGPTTTKITFPVDLGDGTNAAYTLFAVTAYATGTHRRILASTTKNFLSGHYGSMTGVAYHHEGWVISNSQFGDVEDWVIGSDRRLSYHAYGYNDDTGVLTDTNAVAVASGYSGPGQVTINDGTYSESSDFKVAEVIIFQSELTDVEVQSVEDYLVNQYTEATTTTTTTTTTTPPDEGCGFLDIDFFLKECSPSLFGGIQQDVETLMADFAELKAELAQDEEDTNANAAQTVPLNLGGSAMAAVSDVAAQYAVPLLVVMNLLFMVVMVCVVCHLRKSGRGYKRVYAQTAESSVIGKSESEAQML